MKNSKQHVSQVPPAPSESLSSTHFDVWARSPDDFGGTQTILTSLHFLQPQSRDEATLIALDKCAFLALSCGLPWNPFNMTVCLLSK